MALRIFEKWFNVPPWKGAEHITDYQGEKFWVYRFDGEDVEKIRIRHRSYPAGSINLVRDDDTHLTLADIHIIEKYRKRGLGKKLLRKSIQWARENRFVEIWGFIKAHDGEYEAYVRDWYKRQGFEVYETEPGKYQIRMQL
ncbi:MAG: GNAT family N-acetyltransferase [Anaerolineae bacterium]|jgi:ribosomal protein S18 acetylase RimI-like enzyme|nr:GNAT family N-acetyltransferase [Anaerolineae bacterium]